MAEGNFQAVLKGLFAAREDSGNMKVFTVPDYSRTGKPDLVVLDVEKDNSTLAQICRNPTKG